MNLPTLDHPIYTVKLISIDKPVSYRPFLVKEQKLLLMAVEAKDVDTIIKTIKQVINNCVVDPIDVDELPLVDLETMFLHLRARSLGEVMSLYYKCTNQVIVPPNPNSGMMSSASGVPFHEYKACNMVIEVPVNVLQIPVINKDTPKKIMISDSIGVQMRYPSISMIDKLLKTENSEALFSVVATCIETIFDKENIYKTKDATIDEVTKFVENMPPEKFELLEKFIENTPKNRFETKKKCPKCNYEHDFLLEGLSDFFQ